MKSKLISSCSKIAGAIISVVNNMTAFYAAVADTKRITGASPAVTAFYVAAAAAKHITEAPESAAENDVALDYVKAISNLAAIGADYQAAVTAVTTAFGVSTEEAQNAIRNLK